MHIGELAKQVGVNVQTVRFYERQSLLPEPHRTESGYRQYAKDDVRRLQFVRQAKALGFSLDEIRKILRTRDRGLCPCDEVIGIAERHLNEVKRQVRDLEGFRAELAQALRRWKQSKKKNPSPDIFCALIERTMKTRPGEDGSK